MQAAANQTQLPSLREFMDKRSSHSLVELKPQMKNLDLKVIVLTKDQPKELKNKEVLYQCLVADQTGMINCNFYGEAGQAIKTGDIVFLLGAYTSVYKDRMVLYQSQRGGLYRLRDFYFVLGAGGVPNMSEIECLREIDNKGKELYKLKNPPPQQHA